ncbi:nucleoside-diphosphate-sugar epimerase [Paraburkholderia sp. RAU2J]|uniref:SDR family oxidoreductase n=1 Tax=Paraburkholderia sp. RAU2J TaxID=1938810 RepID=UPI000EABFE16|nr:SDR family oxidoreductase [Paraburkholderia sp. RAU2J]RKT22842.1 nucleoside-diphosphate-sugar epimerase [Paraburkholderia sp. RAU2J]
MHVFVTGGTGHAGSHIIPDLVAAGHEVTALARTDESAAAVSALGAKARRGDLSDLDGLKAAAAESDGVIHVGYRADLLQAGGIAALGNSELSIVLAIGEALAGTGKPLVVAGSIGAPTNVGREAPIVAPVSLGRPATEDDPALPSRPLDAGTLRARNVVETAVVGLAEQGVRSSVVRIPLIAHSTADRVGFLQILIGLAKEKGVIGYPGEGKNRWPAVHIRDLASLFRLALEKGPAGKTWHAVADEGIRLREIAEAIAARLGVPAVSIPADELMVPGYFGFLSAVVTGDFPASNAITRKALGWEPAQPGLLEDMDNGHYFPAG